MSSYFK